MADSNPSVRLVYEDLEEDAETGPDWNLLDYAQFFECLLSRDSTCTWKDLFNYEKVSRIMNMEMVVCSSWQGLYKLQTGTEQILEWSSTRISKDTEKYTPERLRNHWGRVKVDDSYLRVRKRTIYEEFNRTKKRREGN